MSIILQRQLKARRSSSSSSSSSIKTRALRLDLGHSDMGMAIIDSPERQYSERAWMVWVYGLRYDSLN